MPRHNTFASIVPLSFVLSCVIGTSLRGASWQACIRNTLPIAALYLASHKPRRVQASMDSQTQDRTRAKKMLHLRHWAQTKTDIMEEIQTHQDKFSYLENTFPLEKGFADIALGYPVVGYAWRMQESLHAGSDYAKAKQNALHIIKEHKKKLDALSLDTYQDLPCFFPCIRNQLLARSRFVQFLQYNPRTLYVCGNDALFDLYTGQRTRTFECNTDDNGEKLNMFAASPVGALDIQMSQDTDVPKVVVGKRPHGPFVSWLPSRGMVLCDTWGRTVDTLIDERKEMESFFGTYTATDGLHTHVPKLPFDGDRFLIVEWQWTMRMTMRLYALKTRAFVRTFDGEASRDGYYTKLSHHTFASLTDTKIQIFDINQSRPIAVLEDKGVRSVLQWDKNYLLAGNEDGSIAVWDMRTEKCIYRFTRSGLPVVSLVKMDDETLLVGTCLVVLLKFVGEHQEVSDYTVFKLIGDTIIDKI